MPLLEQHEKIENKNCITPFLVGQYVIEFFLEFSILQKVLVWNDKIKEIITLGCQKIGNCACLDIILNGKFHKLLFKIKNGFDIF